KIIIGNFNELHNPSRTYMEIFGDWYLVHRTKEDLLRLGKAAGFKVDQMVVGQEEEGVNLFLHIKADISR
ncbi:MAG: class I SAM-dependent methyltransferase, partial [Bacteroidota bacterium]